MALVCGSVPMAEDAVQEALARAWERSERGEHIGSLPAWVATVARNLVFDRFRRLRVERRVRRELAEHPQGRAPLIAVEDRADLAMALASMPRRQREVTVFRYVLDMDVAEVAHALGIPEGTVKSTLHRARRSLAEALTEHEEVEDVQG
jgi:RNA polymerase sigma-70 factor (ECF subfamily)